MLIDELKVELYIKTIYLFITGFGAVVVQHSYPVLILPHIYNGKDAAAAVSSSQASQILDLGYL